MFDHRPTHQPPEETAMPRLRVFLVVLALGAATVARAQGANCPASRPVIDIPGGSTDAERKVWRDKFRDVVVNRDNVIVRLGPDVDFDFGDLGPTDFPIEINRCVVILSVARMDAVPPPEPRRVGPVPARPVAIGPPHSPISLGPRTLPTAGLVPARPFSIDLPTVPIGPGPRIIPSARTSHSVGPVLRFGKHPDITDATAFLGVGCGADGDHDGARISGFRVFGNGDQTVDNVGLRIGGCTDVEVSNMEFAYFGGAGVEVGDPASPGIPGSEPAPIGVLVHDSYIHDNLQPQHGGTLGIGGHAGGYGVNIAQGGWARVYNNTFDNNRHDLTANGKAGGYDAEQNLILKGGGYHGALYETYIHVFDAHGTDNCNTPSSSAWNCGDAGRTFHILENAFQYTKTIDIKFRGKPKGYATIGGNVFAAGDQDSAISGNDNVFIGTDNIYGRDGYGRYLVCDFDGDGIDDLFLATGVSWWFSGQARFPWTHLRAGHVGTDQLRLGYFSGSAKCDVLIETPAGSGQWFISVGGVTDPVARPLGNFGHPLSEVRFGRFDPAVRDHRPGATRQTTHAFWRGPDGAWWVTPLTKPAWKVVGGSGFGLSDLAFGDFNGDGVTDVLAVEQGHWSVSDSATQTWRPLNTGLSDPVGGLIIANLDTDDNIDDILKLERAVKLVNVGGQPFEDITLVWWRSKNGVEPWKVWSAYHYTYPATNPEMTQGAFGLAGRFGPAAGQGATMVIDPSRYGRFLAAPAIRWASGVQY
jgi:hypothetical protein